jgi:hypothetical protein
MAIRREKIEEFPQGRSARRRVGATAVERARWLIGFAVRDLTALKRKQSAEVAWELSAYIDVRLRRDLLVVQPIPDEQVRRCQAWLQEGLKVLRAEGKWKFEIEPLPRHVLQLDPPNFYIMGLDPGFRAFKQVFALETAAFLAQRLRFCPRGGCGNPFVRRKGQRYCSSRCSQTVRSQRFRIRNPNYRRDRYGAGIRTRLGAPNLKVQRRKPRDGGLRPPGG